MGRRGGQGERGEGGAAVQLGRLQLQREIKRAVKYCHHCFQIENCCKERDDLARADSVAEPEYFEVSNHMDL